MGDGLFLFVIVSAVLYILIKKFPQWRINFFCMCHVYSVRRAFNANLAFPVGE